MGALFSKSQLKHAVLVGPAIGIFEYIEVQADDINEIMGTIGSTNLAWCKVSIEEGDFVFYHADASPLLLEIPLNEWMYFPMCRGAVLIVREDGGEISNLDALAVLANRRKAFEKELLSPSFQLMTVDGGLITGPSYFDSIRLAYKDVFHGVPEKFRPASVPAFVDVKSKEE